MSSEEQLPIAADGGDGGIDTAEAPLAPGEPDLPGPFEVGRWAKGFRDFIRKRPRVRLIGEVVNLSSARSGCYFDLRDEDGAVPCAIWNSDLNKLDLPEGTLKDGAEMVVAGGPDYFPGSERSKPGFNFRVTYMRHAGEGDLLARLERLRRRLSEEGLFQPQKRLPMTRLPRTIGVVVGSNSAAFADILAGLERRSWRGRLVLAHPPVQGKAAAPKISAAIRGLAELPEVETIIVSRGGGSLTDLWCFCDEHLCRTVAMLRVPVIAAVGHEVDRTLIDEVAAVCCSTPTHAAEVAVGLDVATARSDLRLYGAKLGRLGRRGVGEKARTLGGSARMLAGHMRSERTNLHQKLREIRAASGRVLIEAGALNGRHATVLARKREAALHDAAGPEARRLTSLAATLAAHDPERVLERGYALARRADGSLIADAASAREAGSFDVRFADDDVAVEVSEDE